MKTTIEKPAVKIQLFASSFRTRWGDSGVEIHYSRAEAIESAMGLLGDDDTEEQEEIQALVDAGKYDEAESALGEALDSSGHEFCIGDAETIDLSRAKEVQA